MGSCHSLLTEIGVYWLSKSCQLEYDKWFQDNILPASLDGVDPVVPTDDAIDDTSSCWNIRDFGRPSFSLGTGTMSWSCLNSCDDRLDAVLLVLLLLFSLLLLCWGVTVEGGGVLVDSFGCWRLVRNFGSCTWSEVLVISKEEIHKKWTH